MEKQLKKLEMKYDIDWRATALGTLFKVKRGLSMYIKDKTSFDYVDKHFENSIPLVQQKTTNNGISAYINKENLPEKFKNKIEKSGQITINPDQPLSYYQEKEFIGNSVIILDTSDVPKSTALYIVSSLQKIRRGSSWSEKFPKEKVKSTEIFLPYTEGKIAFDYIEELFATLEAERLATLEAYLEVSDLKDIKLNSDEKSMVESIKDCGGDFQWKMFTINEIFEVFPSKGYTGLNDSSILNCKGVTPYISNKSQNNGYIGYSKLEALNEGNVITLSDTWQSEKTIFYQPNDFIGKSHLQVLKFRNETFNRFIAWFIISSFRKSILNMNYDYGTKFNRKKIKATRIMLPIENSGEINFRIINQVMVATQKIVIKNVIQMLDDRIKATIKINNN